MTSSREVELIDGEKTAPASFGQQRLWFFDRLQSRSSLYNMHHVMPWPTAVNASTMQSALGEVVRRHEVLRTTFRNVDGSPVQVVQPPHSVPLKTIDLSERSEDGRDREFRRLMNEELTQGFDLEAGPIFNFILVRFGPDYYALSVCVHHIVFDDWSVAVFEQELTTCYEDMKAGRPVSLKPLSLQYAAFGAAQRDRFNRESLDPQLAYWRDRLRDLPPLAGLQTDHPRPPAQTFAGAIRTFSIEPGVARGFRNLTRNADVTPFMSLFAAFAVLLARYSGETDLVVGTPIANRNRPELTGMIGFFVNTLVLRIDISDDPTFMELLGRAREMALGALANQDVPFELLVEELRPEREANRQPLFQSMFVFQPGRGGKEGGKDFPSSGAKFDLTMTAVEGASNLCGEFEYNTDLFEQATMERMARHFEILISSIVHNPQLRISELPLLGAAERQEIVETWNATATPVPSRCVHRIVCDIAARQPDSAALVFEDQTLSYAELTRRATALARSLEALQIAPGVRVGLSVDRSVEWIVGMLGILEAGCAFVPLDPALPADRLMFMIEDAGLDLVLAEVAHAPKLADGPARVVSFDELPDGAVRNDARGADDDLDRLAYIIYTSGSTGRPKGVLVPHRGLTNLALAQGTAWSVDPSARVLQFASLGFDATVSEVFSTLCLGGTLCLAPRDRLMPGPPLLRTLADLRISHVTLPPSALAAMQPEALSDLRVVISAGEACERDLARRWAYGRRFFNAYGPTETTVCATMAEFDAQAPDVPIGKPIGNVQVYVLDRNREPVPPGVIGEIFIGGMGVADGYINRDELTADRFIPDHLTGRPGARLYASGDLGRFDARGTLHHLGRVDSQLKIRGYRIEPGEVETVLRLNPQVNDALVTGYGKGPDARLIAYVVPGDPPPLVVELRGLLARQLPEYMAPAAYVMVEAWPKTANGKIDRAALPRPDSLARDVETVFIEPVNQLEHAIAEIWRDCLGVAQVGATDNFFDLGGHSLLLVRVLEQMKTKLKADVRLTDLFRYPTVKRQAEMIAAQAANQGETETFGQVDQRAARQNAARQNAAARVQRRPRAGGDRHA